LGRNEAAFLVGKTTLPYPQLKIHEEKKGRKEEVIWIRGGQE